MAEKKEISYKNLKALYEIQSDDGINALLTRVKKSENNINSIKTRLDDKNKVFLEQKRAEQEAAKAALALMGVEK